MPENKYDVFISYAHVDADWVHRLAENLHQAGLDVFLDTWEIGPGDVVSHELDRGLEHARNGIVVVSPAALSRPWVQEEYAALLAKAVTRGGLLIPVLLADAELPPMLATRLWVDFRGADGPVYEARVRDLVKAVQGEKPGPPPRVEPRPMTGFRPSGPLRRRLRIDREAVVLEGATEPVREAVAGLSHAAEERLWKLEEALRRTSPEDPQRDDEAVAAAPEPVLERRQLEVGRALGEVFLTGKVAAALRATLQEADASGSSLELGLETDEELADLPWETLCLSADDEPLVLHPRVCLYRRAGGPGPVPVHAVPGPLRVLVAIGSPEAQNARGELLDMERELERILDAGELGPGDVVSHELDRGREHARHGGELGSPPALRRPWVQQE